jgi:hypothetical protein
MLLLLGQNSKAWEFFQKEMLFLKSQSIALKSIFASLNERSLLAERQNIQLGKCSRNSSGSVTQFCLINA